MKKERLSLGQLYLSEGDTLKMHTIASRLANHLFQNTDLEESRIDSVRYGLELILGEVIKWLIVLAVAGFFNVIPEALFAMVTVSVFRLVSGGNHCEDYWRCLTLGLLVFIGGGKLGQALGWYVISGVMLSKMLIVGSLIMAFMILFWAPGEVVYRKIKQEERAMFKGLSLLFLLVWAVIVSFLIAPSYLTVALAGYFAMLFQTFSFTPIGYKFIDYFDYLLSRLVGERRCNNA